MLDSLTRGMAHLLVPLFLTGMAGSAVVVAITLVHDLHDFFSDNGNEAASTDGLS